MFWKPQLSPVPSAFGVHGATIIDVPLGPAPDFALDVDGIIAAANEKGCDLIFMASHGRRGFTAMLLGSETARVLTHTKIPVMVYR